MSLHVSKPRFRLQRKTVVYTSMVEYVLHVGYIIQGCW